MESSESSKGRDHTTLGMLSTSREERRPISGGRCVRGLSCMARCRSEESSPMLEGREASRF